MSEERDLSPIEQTAEQGGWLGAYYDLRATGLHWKKAAFVAWDAAPKLERQPGTLRELAELLNYASDQVFYKWRKQEWYTALGVDQLRESVFIANLADVDRRTIEAALTEGGAAGVRARELYYAQLREARQGEAEEKANQLEIWLRDLRQAGDDEEDNE